MLAVVLVLLDCLHAGGLVWTGARDATLLVTVLDETRGVLPGATVTLAGLEAATRPLSSRRH